MASDAAALPDLPATMVGRIPHLFDRMELSMLPDPECKRWHESPATLIVLGKTFLSFAAAHLKLASDRLLPQPLSQAAFEVNSLLSPNVITHTSVQGVVEASSAEERYIAVATGYTALFAEVKESQSGLVSSEVRHVRVHASNYIKQSSARISMPLCTLGV